MAMLSKPWCGSSAVTEEAIASFDAMFGASTRAYEHIHTAETLAIVDINYSARKAVCQLWLPEPWLSANGTYIQL